MIFKAKNKSGQWEYSDPIQHQFAWECEALYGFDMSRFDTIIDDAENKLSEQSSNTLKAKRCLAFEAYKQKNMELLKERLDYLLIALKFINQGRAASQLSELIKAGYVKVVPQAEALPITQADCASVLSKLLDVNFTSTYAPFNLAGKLSIKAAIKIEQESKRRATAEQVMELLQNWADNGLEPDTLLVSDKKNRAVVWNTKKCNPKTHTLEACETTLKKWNSGRQ